MFKRVKRFSLALTNRMDKELTDFAAEYGLTKASVIRLAIAFYLKINREGFSKPTKHKEAHHEV
jgi:predicted DNA-binding protein